MTPPSHVFAPCTAASAVGEDSTGCGEPAFAANGAPDDVRSASLSPSREGEVPTTGLVILEKR